LSNPESPCVPSPVAAGHDARLSSPATPELAGEFRRLLGGLCLAGSYGLALGARSGGLGLLRHALGAPATLLSVGVIAVPSLFVVLSLFDAPITLERTLAATARAAASSGLLLAGIAPATALLLVTIDSPGAAAFVARAGLLLGGCFGGLPLLAAFHEGLRTAPAGTRFKSRLALLGFVIFGLALAARMASALLPVLGGV
jgi:hypothetical protein